MRRKATYRLRLEELESRTLLSGTPTSFVNQDVGGGGSLYAPAINPANGNDIYLSSDMSQVFHTTNGGAAWQTVNFQQLQGYTGTQVQFTEIAGLQYGINANTSVPSKSTDGGQTWQPLAGDPTGGGAFTLKVDPANHNHMVVTDYTTLYSSTDGGSSFHQVYQTTDTANGLHVAGAFFDGNTIYVGTSKGLLTSTDGGNTFAPSSISGIPSTQAILSFAGAKQNGVTRLFAITADSGNVWAGIAGYDGYMTETVYTATVGQGGWTPSQNGIASNAHPFFVSTAAGNNSVAYLAGGTDGSTPAVYKTTDGGASWQNVLLTGNNQNINTGWQGANGDRNWGYDELALGFEVNPANPNQAVLSGYGFAHMTTDGGATWQVLNVAAADRNVLNSPTPDGKAYHSTGLDNTTVWGINWVDANHLIGASTDIHGVISADGGASWSLGYTGQTYNTLYRSVTAANGVVYGAASSVHDLYQSTYLADSRIDGGSGAVLFSADKGVTWQAMHNFGHPVVWVATDPNNANRLYASVVSSTAGGIYVTNDAQDGANSVWTKLATPPRTQGHPLDVQVLNDGTLVASYSGRRDASGNFQASAGVFVSTDGGQSWQDRSAAGMKYWTQDVVIDPADATQSTWYAGVYSGWNNGASNLGGLYKTTDRGVTWTRVFASDGVTSVTPNPTNAGEMYVTTEDDGLYFTANRNASSPTFSQVSAYPFKQPERVFFNPYNTNQVWVTSFGGGMFVGSTGTATTPATPATPTAGVSGPATGTTSQALSFTLSASETGLSAGTQYTFNIDWDGNGTVDQTVAGASGTTVNHTFATAGSYTVKVTATDPSGTTSAAATTAVSVSNPTTTTTPPSGPATPTAAVSGPASGAVGQVLTFTLGASEAGLPATTKYFYTIDWDGNGSIDQTLTGLSGTTASHAYAAAGSYTIRVTATDPSNATSAVTTTAVTVGSSATTAIAATTTTTTTVSSPAVTTATTTTTTAASMSGPAAGVRGQTLTYTLNGGTDSYTYQIDWNGDGTVDQTVSGGNGTQVSHVFTDNGSYAVKVTAVDASGNKATTSAATTISAVALLADPTDATKTALFVGGTTGADTITVSPADAAGTVQVTINGVSQGTFLPTGHIYIYGQDGNDTLQVASATVGGNTVYVSQAAMLFAGNGADTLDVTGSTANNVLVGGAGSDILNGGKGRDLLIGGAGSDSFSAGSSGDIEVAGSTDFDTDVAALNAIMAEWGRTDVDYATRVAHLNGSQAGGLNGGSVLNTATVHDDQATDYLYGGWQALDCYFAHSGTAADQVNGVQTGETVTNI